MVGRRWILWSSIRLRITIYVGNRPSELNYHLMKRLSMSKDKGIEQDSIHNWSKDAVKAALET
jgi:hypothetical protein